MLPFRPFSSLAPTLAAAALALSLAAPAIAQAGFSEGYQLLEAVKKKDGNKVTDLLAKGSPNLINHKDKTTGQTALHIATERQEKDWMSYLLAKGANVNARDFKGATPLVVAANMNYAEGVDLLLARGARVDESSDTGETPLITAVHNRNIGMMRALLKAGADADRADNSGRTARDYAKLDAKSTSLLAEIEANAKPKNPAGKAKSYGPVL